jgi:hypothetical protein
LNLWYVSWKPTSFKIFKILPRTYQQKGFLFWTRAPDGITTGVYFYIADSNPPEERFRIDLKKYFISFEPLSGQKRVFNNTKT